MLLGFFFVLSISGHLSKRQVDLSGVKFYARATTSWAVIEIEFKSLCHHSKDVALTSRHHCPTWLESLFACLIIFASYCYRHTKSGIFRLLIGIEIPLHLARAEYSPFGESPTHWPRWPPWCCLLHRPCLGSPEKSNSITLRYDSNSDKRNAKRMKKNHNV